jgi:hypothetical protein
MASAPSADGAPPSTPPSARAAAAAAAAAFADHAGEDAPGTPTSEAGGLDEEQQGSFAAAAGTGAGADTLLASHKLGSKRAALKAKLVDAVDSSAMWERHISSTLGEK